MSRVLSGLLVALMIGGLMLLGILYAIRDQYDAATFYAVVLLILVSIANHPKGPDPA